MRRSTTTALGLFVGLAVLVAGGMLVVRQWRAVKPAVAPPPTAIGDLFSPPKNGGPSPVPAVAPTPPFPLTLADGYQISLYMSGFAKPRVLVLDPRGTPLVSDMEEGAVYALPDENGDGAADKRTTVLEKLNTPHGLAFRGDTLYVAETNQVVRYAYNPETRAASNPQRLLELPTGGGHSSRTIAFGPDGKLYVAVGSSCNVCREHDQRRAAILRVDPDTGASERWAWGLRNTVFFTFHPETGAMLGNDMGRDLLGDNLPPDELNVMTGGDYGWPYCYGKRVDDPFGTHPDGCNSTEPSLYDYPAHVAPLGIRFIPAAFSAEHAGDLLVSFHGSWNSTTPVGYKVVRLDIEDDRVVGMDDFLTGFLSPDGRALGRPVDLLFLPDGSLLISDDHAGAVYRVTRS